jgi:hypothetical protein
VAGLSLAACGSSGNRQDVAEPSGKFPVTATASFPTSQSLSQHTHLVIRVTNSGHDAIPNVAVTICNVTCAFPAPKGEGSSSSAFAANIGMQYVANPSRPVWIVDHPPGICGYSCQSGGAGGAASAYSNTWALGRLKPHATAVFKWDVTAVQPGHHVVAWEVAAGLNGKAKAVGPNGSAPSGTFSVFINNAPAKSFVNDSGQIVQSP